jgi:elongation factor 4
VTGTIDKLDKNSA